MKTMKMILCLVCVICLISSHTNPLFSQNASESASADTSTDAGLVAENADSTANASTASEFEADVTGEIILEEIKIEAVVETPSVGIVPKRVDPEFGQMEFMDRSFEKELKAVPKQPMLISNELKGVNKIKKKQDRIYQEKSK